MKDWAPHLQRFTRPDGSLRLRGSRVVSRLGVVMALVLLLIGVAMSIWADGLMLVPGVSLLVLGLVLALWSLNIAASSVIVIADESLWRVQARSLVRRRDRMFASANVRTIDVVGPTGLRDGPHLRVSVRDATRPFALFSGLWLDRGTLDDLCRALLPPRSNDPVLRGHAPAAESGIWPAALGGYVDRDGALVLRGRAVHPRVWLVVPFAALLVFGGVFGAVENRFHLVFDLLGLAMIGSAAMILVGAAVSIWGVIRIVRDERYWTIISGLGPWSRTSSFPRADVVVARVDRWMDKLWPDASLRLEVRHLRRPVTVGRGVALDPAVLDALRQAFDEDAMHFSR